MNAAELLLAGRPDAVAVYFGGARITYRELRARAARAAAAWQACGLRTGSRAVIALPDGADWVAGFLGLIWLGGQPIAVSPRTEAAVLRDIVADSGACALLLEDARAAEFGDPRALGLGAWRERVAAAASDLPPHPAAEDDEAFWLYSSGTTGKPKGIVHAHRAAAQAHVFAREVLGATPRDVFYSTSKLFFAYPLANALFAALRLGAAVVLDAEWPNPQQVAENLSRFRPTLFFSVPTLYRRLLEAGVAFDSVRRAVSAGEACPPDVARGWLSHTGAPLVNGYGTTETLSLVLYREEGADGLRPTPLTRVLAEAEEGGRDGAVRLWFAHPAVARGYSRVVTHDSARFGSGGFSPGDIFRPAVGTAGAWTFAGRSDQLIKVFGRWVDTLALEQTLAQMLAGKVGDICIVPAGAEGDDTVALHLFAVSGAAGEAETGRIIDEALAALPAYRRPQAVHLLAELPRTETGKLRRGVLGKMLE